MQAYHKMWHKAKMRCGALATNKSFSACKPFTRHPAERSVGGELLQ